MAPKFGTSGLRGLVTELSPALCAGYVNAFLDGVGTNGTLLIGRDLRASSPRIATAVAGAVAAHGLRAIECGVLPTPALALAAEARGTAAVMVTGSHISDDRNGLKFFSSEGEITKSDEERIAAAYALANGVICAKPEVDGTAVAKYRERYVDFFGGEALLGLRIGVYEHSSAARDLLADVLATLGAETVTLGRADRFLPVDTEALHPGTREKIAGWVSDHDLDALVSTDGDADRPMVADARGTLVPGDKLGPLTAMSLGAEIVVTPVSSNSCVDELGCFDVIRTRIGSPFVIEGMAAHSGTRVVGYEANGGFLLGFEAIWNGRRISSLATRDSLLPMLMPLVRAREEGRTLAELVDELPPRFTAADRLVGITPKRTRAFLAALDSDRRLSDRLTNGIGIVSSVDRTDGWRATFTDRRVLHLRPSGNAPEFRLYTEANSDSASRDLLTKAIARVSAELNA